MGKALCLAISHPFHAAHRVMALQTFRQRFVKQLPSLPAAQRGLALQTSLHVGMVAADSAVVLFELYVQ